MSLEKVFEQNSITSENIKINHFLVPIHEDSIKEEYGTRFVTVTDRITVTNLNTGEELSWHIPLVNVPQRGPTGYLIKNVARNLPSITTVIHGWILESKKKQNRIVYEAAFKSDNLSVSGKLNDYKDSSQFRIGTRVEDGITRLFIYRREQRNRYPLELALSALTGESLDILYNKLNINDTLLDSFLIANEYPRGILEQELMEALGLKHNNLIATRKKLLDIFFGKINTALGISSKKTDRYVLFRQMIQGGFLAEDVLLGNKLLYPKYTIITPEILDVLDYTPINTIKVQEQKDAYVYTFNKYGNYVFRGLNQGFTYTIDGNQQKVNLEFLKQQSETDKTVLHLDNGKVLSRELLPTHNTIELLYAVINKLINYYRGYKIEDNIFSVENQIILTPDERATSLVDATLKDINKTVIERMNAIDSEFSLLSLKQSFKEFNINSYIEEIATASGRELQTAYLTNCFSCTQENASITLTSKSIPLKAAAFKMAEAGILDPMAVSESKNMGANNFRCLHTEIKDGIPRAPYLVVTNGVVQEDMKVYLSAEDTKNKYIADCRTNFEQETVLVRYNEDARIIKPEMINYIELSPYQHMSAASCTMVHPENSAGKRRGMAPKAPVQSLPIIGAERPIDSSGIESLILENNKDTYIVYTARDLIIENRLALDIDESQSLESLELHLKGIKLDKSNSRAYTFTVIDKDDETFSKSLVVTKYHNHQSLQKSSFGYQIVSKKNIFSIDDIVLHMNTYDINEDVKVQVDEETFSNTGYLKIPEATFKTGAKLGYNMKVAWKTKRNLSIEDAIVINSSLVDKSIMTHLYVYTHEFETQNTEKKKESFSLSSSITNPPAYFKNGNFYPELGTMLDENSPVGYKVIERLNRTDISNEVETLYLPGIEGKVIDVTIIGNKYQITVLSLKPIHVGDKLMGRCGNKGIVSKIIPFQYMDYDPKTGEVMDVILNPLGIPSRMNLSQVVETVLAAVCRERGYDVKITTPYQTNLMNQIKEEAKENGVEHVIKPRKLVDGETGRETDRAVQTGIIYMHKVMHLSKPKMNAIGYAKHVDPTFSQPQGKGSKEDRGQSFSDMELWALGASNTPNLMQEIQTISSNALIQLGSKRSLAYKVVEKELYNGNEISLANLSNNLININKDTMLMLYTIYGFTTYTKDNQLMLNIMSNKHFERTIAIFEMATIIKRLKSTNLTNDSWITAKLPFEIVNPIHLLKLRILSYIPLYQLDYSKKNKESKSAKKSLQESIIDDLDEMYEIEETEENKESIDVEEIVEDEEEQIENFEIDTGYVFSYLRNGARKLLERNIYIEMKNSKIFIAHQAHKITDEQKEKFSTGMEGIVLILKNYNVDYLMNYFKTGEYLRLDGEKKTKKKSLISTNAKISDFVELYEIYVKRQQQSIENEKKKGTYSEEALNLAKEKIGKDFLQQFVVNYIPIVPQKYRPGTSIAKKREDFEMYYEAMARHCNETGGRVNAQDIEDFYGIYCVYLGVGIPSMITKHRDIYLKFLNVRAYLMNHANNGRIRENVLAKRTHRSGRATIITTDSTEQTPNELKVSWSMLVHIFKIEIEHLIASIYFKTPLNQISEPKLIKEYLDLLTTNNYYKAEKLLPALSDEYEGISIAASGKKRLQHFKKICSQYMNKEIVESGRQPTLHKYGLNTSYVIPDDDYVLKIHPLTCPPYNADFDGDQKYVYAPVSKEAKKEAKSKTLFSERLLNSGTGEIILKASQDIVLGCYYATMYKDNELYPKNLDSILFYTNLEHLYEDIKLGSVTYHTWILYTRDSKYSYFSTAGRILFNSLIHGFTDEKYTNKPDLVAINNTSNYSEKIKNLIQNILQSKNLRALKYDCIITGTVDSRKKDAPYLASLKVIFKELYELYNERPTQNTGKDLVILYNEISQFGFTASDHSGITFSIDDLKESEVVNDFLAKTKKLLVKLEEDYNDGLITTEDKINAIVKIYEGMKSDELIAKFIDNFGRNNNMFLMAESKARGSLDQILQTCGDIGILKKDNKSRIEIPIMSNYTKGLSPIQSTLMAFAVRTDALNKAQGTSAPVDLTRNLIYLSGATVANTTLKKPQKYTEVKEFRIPYEYASKAIFYSYVNEEGEGMYEVLDVDNLPQLRIKDDYFKIDEVLTPELIPYLRAYQTSYFNCEKGRIEFDTKPVEYLESFLEYRYVEECEIFKGNENHYLTQGKYINPKGIKKLKEEKCRSIRIRNLNNCFTEDIPVEALGLNSGTLRTEPLGTNMGILGASTLGEPIAQLNLDIVNDGGKYVEEASPLAVFKSAIVRKSFSKQLQGRQIAKFAPINGKVIVTVSNIENIDSNKESLARLQQEEPEFFKTLEFTIKIVSDKKVTFSLDIPVKFKDLAVYNGQTVFIGTRLTQGVRDPLLSFSGFSVIDLNIDSEYEFTYKDNFPKEKPLVFLYDLELIQYMRFYMSVHLYNLYAKSGIERTYRCFEVIGYSLYNCAKILYIKNSNETEHKYNELIALYDAEDYLGKCILKVGDSDLLQTIVENNGGMTAAVFQDSCKAVLYHLVKQEKVVEKSMFSSIVSGADLSKENAGIASLSNTTEESELSVLISDLVKDQIEQDYSKYFTDDMIRIPTDESEESLDESLDKINENLFDLDDIEDNFDGFVFEDESKIEEPPKVPEIPEVPKDQTDISDLRANIFG